MNVGEITKEQAEKLKEVMEANKQPEVQLAPVVQSCLIKTKHGMSKDCKFWIHTDKYFQYYEDGYKVVDKGDGNFLIEGDTVIIPNHEIRYVIIRHAQSSIPEGMFLALGGKKKMIKVVGENAILKK